jgi:hypothetical protein
MCFSGTLAQAKRAELRAMLKAEAERESQRR